MTVARLTLPASVAALALGILLAERVGPPVGAALVPTALLGAALAIIGFAWPRGAGRTAVLLASVALIGVAAGAWRQIESSAPPDGPSVAALVDGAEHAIAGRVAGDPRPRDERLQVVLGELSAVVDGAATRLGDRLLLWLPRGVALQDGDLVRLSTQVEVPEDFDGFAYRAFLARQGVGGIGRAESVELLAAGGGPGAVLTAVRDTLLGGLNRIVPEPQAALGAGILLGVRSAIAPEINEGIRTGRAHPRRRHLGLEHRDRRRPRRRPGPPAREARRPVGRCAGFGSRGRRVRGAHRRHAVGRARSTHGRGDPGRKARRIARTWRLGAGTGRAGHAARRSVAPVGRRVPALCPRHRRPDLVRGAGRAAAGWMADTHPRAGRAHARRAAHHAAGDPRELRAALARRAAGKRARGAARAAGHAVQRRGGGHRRARGGCAACAPGRRRGVARRRHSLAGARRHDRCRLGHGRRPPCLRGRLGAGSAGGRLAARAGARGLGIGSRAIGLHRCGAPGTTLEDPRAGPSDRPAIAARLCARLDPCRDLGGLTAGRTPPPHRARRGAGRRDPGRDARRRHHARRRRPGPGPHAAAHRRERALLRP